LLGILIALNERQSEKEFRKLKVKNIHQGRCAKRVGVQGLFFGGQSSSCEDIFRV
jgi:hypothetical protein